MHQVPDDAVAMLARLCVFGPVLYAGLIMVIDSGKILTLLNRVASEIASLESSVRDPFRRPETVVASPGWRRLSRFSGVALVLFSLVHIIGLVS